MFSLAITIAIENRTYHINICKSYRYKSILKQNKYYKVSQLNCYSYNYLYTLEIVQVKITCIIYNYNYYSSVLVYEINKYYAFIDNV